jgi:hypothetical protein
MNHSSTRAESDCEEIRPGLIGQPSNTLSSLALVAAAVPIWRAARRRSQPAWRAVAVATALEGLGSVAYLGPGGRQAKRLPDHAIVALAATIAGAVAREGRPLRRPRTAALAGAAVALHTLSRTGGPLCSCRSPLQGHAVFHLLAAAALVSAATEPERPQRAKTSSTSSSPSSPT